MTVDIYSTPPRKANILSPALLVRDCAQASPAERRESSGGSSSGVDAARVAEHPLDGSRQVAGVRITCLAFTRFPSDTRLGFGDFHVHGWHLFRILGCPAHAGNDRCWVGLPGKPLTDRNGVPVRDETAGRIRHVSFAAYNDKDLLRSDLIGALDWVVTTIPKRLIIAKLRARYGCAPP